MTRALVRGVARLHAKFHSVNELAVSNSERRFRINYNTGSQIIRATNLVAAKKVAKEATKLLGWLNVEVFELKAGSNSERKE